MTGLNKISASVQSGSARQTADLVSQAIKDKCPLDAILKEGLVSGMMEMEKKFHRNEVLDSQVHIADWAMKAGLEVLMPLLEEKKAATPESPPCTVITGTLEGDIRETEKNIMAIMMQSMGLNVIDLGTGVSPMRFVKTAADEKAQLIVCAAALTSFLPQMKSLVEAANRAMIRAKTKIMLSGRPVTEWFCKCIDADIYAPDLVQAAEMAAEYCKKMHGELSAENLPA